MADRNEAITDAPAIDTSPKIQGELGLSLRVDLGSTLVEAQKLKFGATALSFVKIGFFENTIPIKFKDNEGTDKKSNLCGEAQGNQIRIFMGSIAARAQELYKEPKNKHSMDQLLSMMASRVLVHELSHVSDNFNKGRKQLEREDRLYERRRQTRAVLPGAATIATMVGWAAIPQVGIEFIGNLPWWARAMVSMSSLVQLRGTFSGIRETRRKAREHTYQTGEKVYQNHPSEKRAFGKERSYAKRLEKSGAPLLVHVKTIEAKSS